MHHSMDATLLVCYSSGIMLAIASSKITAGINQFGLLLHNVPKSVRQVVFYPVQ